MIINACFNFNLYYNILIIIKWLKLKQLKIRLRCSIIDWLIDWLYKKFKLN